MRVDDRDKWLQIAADHLRQYFHYSEVMRREGRGLHLSSECPDTRDVVRALEVIRADARVREIAKAARVRESNQSEESDQSDQS